MQSALIIGTEKYDDVIGDAMPLLKIHHQEVCWKPEKFPLDVDHDKYRALEKAGALKIYTAREAGILVGYAAFFVAQHLHYKGVRVATNDVFFIAPERRGVWLGINLLRFAKAELKKEGAQVASIRMKTFSKWDALARRAGFECVDLTYLNWMGD